MLTIRESLRCILQPHAYLALLLLAVILALLLVPIAELYSIESDRVANLVVTNHVNRRGEITDLSKIQLITESTERRVIGVTIAIYPRVVAFRAYTPLGESTRRDVLALSHIRDLVLTSEQINSCEFASILQMQELNRFRCMNCEVFGGGNGMNRSTSSAIVTVDLSGSILSSELLADIGSCMNVRELRLAECRFDRDMNRLCFPQSLIQRLRLLDLSYTSASAGVIEQLRRADNLEELCLSGTSIEDSSLEILARLPSLRVLRISETQISGDGVRILANCERLSDLYVYKCRYVLDEAIASLRDSSPAVRVHK